MHVNTLFTNATIVRHTGTTQSSIGTQDGKIVFVGTDISSITANTTVDLTGKTVIPGLIDGHIHFQDPGFTHRDDLQHGTAACAISGITTAISHPVNNPAAIDENRFNQTLEAYKTKSHVDYALHGGAVSSSIADVQGLWKNTGATSIKMFMCFSVKEFPFVEKENMKHILENIAAVDGLALIHCEDSTLITQQEERLAREGRTDPMAYNESRPEIVEIVAIKKTISLLKETGAKALIVHVSTEEGLRLINEAQHQGVNIWAETCPHFLSFVREDMIEHGPFLKFSPVMRDEKNRVALWDLLNKGFIHTIGSDHCPFTLQEKEAGLENIFLAPNGIPGLETMLPVLLDGVNKGLTSLEKIVEITSFNPAHLYGLAPQKGLLEVGADCDFVVVDLELEQKFSQELIFSKCPWSPYIGRSFTGWATMTVLRGKIIAEDGRLTKSPGFGNYLPRRKEV